MGLFDKIFGSSKTTYTPQNKQEAIFAVMYACMATDGEVSQVEIDVLCRLLVYKQDFAGHDIPAYHRVVAPIHIEVGSKVIIDSSVSVIPAEDKPTLFAMVMELLLADGVLGPNEQEIAAYLAEKLPLDLGLTQKIVDVILIKNKGNVILSV
jgi:hypothetical protein